MSSGPGVQPATGSRQATTFTREYGLDALRAFAFSLLILYHSGMGFVTWPWHVKNPELSTALQYPMLFANRWRLPLLFFISGAGAAFSLRRRDLAQFANERIRRLLIPLLVGMFVIVPPQIYLERLTQGVQFESYLAFYRTVFDLKPYPQGSTSWHHLWFVAYVLVYALVSIPFFTLLRSASGKRGLAAFAGWLERMPLAIYLINIPNLLTAILLGPHWPATNNLVSDWANLTGAWLTFLWGFIFASETRLLDIVTRRRREFLFVGIVMAIVFFSLFASRAGDNWPRNVQLIAGNLVSGYFSMAWILMLVGYARVGIKRSTPFLRYATEAVYPFYIIHQTITVALVYALIGWRVGVWPKFAAVAAGTFLGSWCFFEVVRRIRFLRPLFGMKWNPREPVPAISVLQ